MKKMIVGAMAVLLTMAVFATTPNPQTSGYGEVRQLTATNVRITWDNNEWVHAVSIYNGSSVAVYALVNVSSADFDTAKAASPSNVIVIPAGTTYTFSDQRGTRKITSLVLDAASDTGSANVYIAAY